MFYFRHLAECVVNGQVLTEILHGTHEPRIALAVMYAIFTYIRIIRLGMPLAPEIGQVLLHNSNKSSLSSSNPKKSSQSNSSPSVR